MDELSIVEWSSGDWLAVYVAGKLYYEGHSMQTDQWVNLLNKYIISRVELFEYHYDENSYEYWGRAPGIYLNDFREGELKRIT